MTYELDPCGIDHVEYHISPPMDAITIPVKVNGQNYGIAIYVAASPFLPLLPQSKMELLLKDLAARLTVKEEH